MLKNIGIIFDEGPIARCLYEIIKRENIDYNELVYLGKRNFLSNNFYINYNNNLINSKPIKYLNSPEFQIFINEIENYFNLGEGFFKDAYLRKDLIKDAKKFYFINDKNINSEKVLETVSECKSKYFLNTGKQILKTILKLKKKFLHIHPAFLPNIKGADGSLWNIKERGKFGGTLFVMNEKIDEGDILYKLEIELKSFNLIPKKFYLEFYDIWFSFVDPAIRCFVLKNSVKKDMNLNYAEKNSHGKYFSFMEKNLKQKILQSVICLNEN